MTDVRRADELWDAAAEVAASDGTMLGATLRQCLARFNRRALRRKRRGHSDRK